MKRNLIISGAIATAVTLFGAAGISTGELDLPGLNQRIDNIDARTTNNESDIKTLQAATQTTPGVHVDVPAATTANTVKTAAVPQSTLATAAAQALQPPVEVATPSPTPTPFIPYVELTDLASPRHKQNWPDPGVSLPMACEHVHHGRQRVCRP